MHRLPYAAFALLLATVLALGACKRKADSRPLDEAGLAYTAIQQLHQMNITDEEALEVVKVKLAAMSDLDCIELVRIARSRGGALTDGDEVHMLRTAEMSEAAVIRLAQMNQLGPWAREAQAMLLTGFSEATVLEVAERRSNRQTVLSGPAMARLKNAGLTEQAIVERMRNGATDASVDSIIQELRPKQRGFRRP